MNFLLFILFVLTLYSIVYVISAVIDIYKIRIYRFKKHELSQTIKASSLPVVFINYLLHFDFKYVSAKRIELLKELLSQERLTRTNKYEIRKSKTLLFFDISSSELKSDERFIYEAHALLGSLIFDYIDNSLLQEQNFWKNIPLKDHNEWYYWPKSFYEDENYILSIYFIYFREVLPLIDNSLKSNPKFILKLLQRIKIEKLSKDYYDIIFSFSEVKNFNEQFYIATIKDIGLELVKFYPSKFNLNSNSNLIKEIFISDSRILEYACDDILNNREFMIDLAIINPNALRYTGDSLKRDNLFFNICISKNIPCLSKIPQQIENYRALALAAIKNNSKEITGLNKEFKNSKEFILEALGQSPENWPFFYSYLYSEFSKYQDNVFGIHNMISKPENQFDEKVMNFISSSTNEKTELLPIITSCCFGDNLRPGPRFVLTNYQKTLLNKIQNKISDFKIKMKNSSLKKNEEINSLVLDINHDYNMFFKNHFEHMNHVLLKFFLITIIRNLSFYD